MDNSTSSAECPECGREIPAEAPHGICPRCLLSEAVTGSHPPPHRADLDSISLEEVAKAFPQLEVMDRIGGGGMGVVYKARHRKLDRLVAVKLIRAPETEGDDGFASRFLREARALAKLSHPNIVAVHDFGEAGEFYFLIMEFVDGVDLRRAMDSGGCGPEQALSIVPVICEALQFAHDQGILHRDIKPANILLDKDGTVKIADFGLAKFVEKGEMLTGLTHAEATLGTPAYMAPEQMERPNTVDHRADIYSLGVVFYEMLTGELPLGRFPEPSKKSRVNREIDGVVMRTLEKEPAERYQSAREMGSEVEHASSSGLHERSGRLQTGMANPGEERDSKAGTKALAPAPPVDDGEKIRFSWLGLVGTLLLVPGVLTLLALVFFLVKVASQRGGGIGVPELLIVLCLAGLPGLIATILGGIELRQVRRDGVRPRGMMLAWIASATWPTCALVLMGIVLAVVGLNLAPFTGLNTVRNVLVIPCMLTAVASGIGLACLLIGKTRRWVYRLPGLSKNRRALRIGLAVCFLLLPVLVPIALSLIRTLGYDV